MLFTSSGGVAAGHEVAEEAAGRVVGIGIVHPRVVGADAEEAAGAVEVEAVSALVITDPRGQLEDRALGVNLEHSPRAALVAVAPLEGCARRYRV